MYNFQKFVLFKYKKNWSYVILASQIVMLMLIFLLKMADNQSSDARPLQFVSFSSSVHPGDANDPYY